MRRKKIWDPTDDPWKHDMFDQLEAGRSDRYEVRLRPPTMLLVSSTRTVSSDAACAAPSTAGVPLRLDAAAAWGPQMPLAEALPPTLAACNLGPATANSSHGLLKQGVDESSL